MNKYFIITVDTEGDNLWAWHKGDPINTANSKYIPRFQELCNQFGFKPVYLTNYEMLLDDDYCAMVREWQSHGICEVGLHLHSWNTPPLYNLDACYNGNPYLIEYPEDVMRSKFNSLYELFVSKIGSAPFSHRAGRWAMNDLYFDILNEHGVKVDCSHTPHISWANNLGETMGGVDYSNASEQPSLIRGIMQVPVSIRIIHHMLRGGVKTRLKTLVKGEALQLRPANFNVAQMKKLINRIEKESDTNYLEFMLHSSELMPGGSPYFPDISSIEHEYFVVETIFHYVQRKGYLGATLKDYYSKIDL